jgi:LysM repeat protein
MTPKKDNAAPRRPLSRVVRRQKLHARAASRDDMDDFESEAEPGMKLSQAFFVVLLLHILAVGGIYAFNQIKSVSKASPTAKAEAPAEPIAKPAPLNEEAAPVASAPAAAELPAASSTASARTHTVVAGDTLHRIAGKYGVNVAALEKANNLQNNSIIRVGQVLSLPEAAASTPQTASTPAKAEPAVVAKSPPTVPATEKTSQAAPKAAEEKPAQASSSSKTYTVAKGDNPYSIAKKLKVNPIELMKANKIDDPRKLQIGQKLVVP